MRRRELIALVAIATAWPLIVHAQPQRLVIRLLSSASPERFAHLILAFREGLQELGYKEGENVLIEYRWANDQIDQLAVLAEELARRQVTIIVASGGTAPALAAKAVTSEIPDRLHGSCRPGRARPRRQPWPARWQCHRKHCLHKLPGPEAA